MKNYVNPEKATWPEIVKRPVFDYRPLEAKVSSILEDVKLNRAVDPTLYVLAIGCAVIVLLQKL